MTFGPGTGRGVRALMGGTMPSFRSILSGLHHRSSPAPWAWDGELYGLPRGREVQPLGFAPHRPCDARLIAEYRNAVPRLLEAVAAVEALATTTEAAHHLAHGVGEALATLDAAGGGGDPSYRDVLLALDGITTQPPWEPGHLAGGMGWVADGTAEERPAPAATDAELIAASRIAVPRLLRLLTEIEEAVHRADGEAHRLVRQAIAELDTVHLTFTVPQTPIS